MISLLAETGATGGIIEAVLAVFTLIANWFVQTIPTITAIFYDPASGLTLLGMLAVAALAVSVFFLIMGIIQRFLHFRG